MKQTFAEDLSNEKAVQANCLAEAGSKGSSTHIIWFLLHGESPRICHHR